MQVLEYAIAIEMISAVGVGIFALVFALARSEFNPASIGWSIGALGGLVLELIFVVYGFLRNGSVEYRRISGLVQFDPSSDWVGFSMVVDWTLGQPIGYFWIAVALIPLGWMWVRDQLML